MQQQMMRPDAGGTLGGSLFGVNHFGLRTDTRMMVRFYMDRVSMMDADGVETMQPREHIEFPLLGEQTKVRRLATDDDRKRYADAYRAFSQGLDAPVRGTPLEDLPGITQRAVQMAAMYGVRTIEDMADPRSAQTLGRDGPPLQARCKAWLQDRAGAVEIDRAEQLARVSGQMETMMARLAEMEVNLKAKDAVIAAMQGAGVAGVAAAAGNQMVQHVSRDEDEGSEIEDAFTAGDGFADDAAEAGLAGDESDLDTVD